jgi:succinoglycan biosynthesis protein ExoO
MTPKSKQSRPVVSVVVANYNGQRYLAEALRSILTQSLTELEVLFVDDASTDRSVAIAEAMATKDRRLQVHRLTANAGPAAARTYALTLARGAWIAVVDSDDYIHPERLQRLVTVAEADDADIIADDQLVFDGTHHQAPRRLLSGALASAASWVTPAQYVLANRMCARATPLGYLKPLIRTSMLAEHHICYAETLRIAEDYDLVARLLARGARFRLLPELLYFYRRHDASISHRLSAATLRAMVAADTTFRIWAGARAVAPLQAALDARVASIHVVWAAETAIAGLKACRPLAALAAMVKQPGAIPIVARLATPPALIARMRRPTSSPSQAASPVPPRPTICVLSRQRLTVGSSGSAAYLLSMCRTLRESGFALHLICPSPAVLGRLPVLRIAGRGEIFDRVAVRGTYRIGGLYIARDPMVFLRAAIAVVDRVARHVGIAALSPFARPAAYAVGLPWTAEDLLFVAAESHGHADIVLADYGFLTPGIPYALRPGAASAVVMHDLFSSRPAAFASIGTPDSVATLGEAAEASLLARAGLVIAIQSEEATAARRILPRTSTVLVAPMAIESVATAQSGEGGGLLFVGSAAAANIDGMNWFLAEIWPLIRARYADTQLIVAGAVCARLSVPAGQHGVNLLGRVPDLAPLYRRADVVISPLRVGSGLKIKLVEALAHGKPVVATTVTAQGVAHLLTGAVALADRPRDFAEQVLDLLAKPQLRAMRAEAALAVARRSFSARTAYAGVVDHLRAQHVAQLDAMRRVMKLDAIAPAPSPPADRVAAWDPAMALPFISIVVPTLNEEHYIESCLASLIGQWPEGAYEILVLDGGSTDRTLPIVAAFHERHGAVTLVHNPRRRQSAAMNLGAQAASPLATVLVRADAHAHYTQNFIRSCVLALLQTGATSVVVPMQTQAQPGATLQRAIAAAQSSRLGNGGSPHRAGSVSGFVEHGHHAAFDRGFFRSIGGYDESFTHNEDAELDVRAIGAGGSVWMCAKVSVVYYPRDRLHRLAQQYFRHGGGRARTLRKHRLRPKPRQLVPVVALAGCTAGLVVAPFLPTVASLGLLYPLICLAWAMAQAIRRRDVYLITGGVALMTMHLSWALGFLIGFARASPNADATLKSENSTIRGATLRNRSFPATTPAQQR